MSGLGLATYGSSDSEDERPAAAPETEQAEQASTAPAPKSAPSGFAAFGTRRRQAAARRGGLPLFSKPVANHSSDSDDEARSQVPPALARSELRAVSGSTTSRLKHALDWLCVCPLERCWMVCRWAEGGARSEGPSMQTDRSPSCRSRTSPSRFMRSRRWKKHPHRTLAATRGLRAG